MPSIVLHLLVILTITTLYMLVDVVIVKARKNKAGKAAGFHW